MATDLTTLASVKSYMHITGTSSDTLLTSLISQVSRRIETDCGRTFGAANYVEFHNTGTRQQRIQIRNKPVIQVNRVGWGYATALQVSYTGSNVFSSVQVTPDRRCVVTEITNSGTTNTTTFNLTTSSMTLASQLVTGIAAISGFSANLMGNVDVPTKWLFDTAGVPLKSANASYTQSIGWPNVDVMTYIVDPTFSTIAFTPMSSMDYMFRPDGGQATPLSFPGTYQGVCIDYRGGYETIPDDIALLSNQVIADTYNLSLKDNNLTSEALGDYTYTLADQTLRRLNYVDRLAPYKKITIAGGMG